MKKYNLKKIMSDAHILYNYLKKQGYSFGECLKRIWNSAKNGSSLTYLNCYISLQIIMICLHPHLRITIQTVPEGLEPTT